MLFRKSISWLICSTLVCAVGCISAQIDSSERTDSIPFLTKAWHLPGVVIRASKTKSISSISRINRNEIEKSFEPTIEPLLNATPGLWMQSGALNTNRISIRGVGYREPFATTGIKVYLNEIPLTNGVGESSIEDIHPEILSGIDIWRGPASTIWGSGLGGAIHLQSWPDKDNGILTKIQGGSFGRIQFDQSLNFGKAQPAATKIHYQYLHDDGYRDNNQYNKHSATWLQFFRIKEFSFNSFLHFIDLKAFIPSSLNKNDFENRPFSAAPAWDAIKGNEDYIKMIGGITGQYISANNLAYNGSVFITTFQSDEVRPFNILDEGSISYGTRHRLSKEVNHNLFLNAGVEYFGEKYKFSTFETLSGGTAGEQLTSMTEYRNSVNLFLQSEFELNAHWSGYAGLHSSFSYLSGVNSYISIPVSVYPTAGIQYKFSHHFTLSASASRGYTALSLDDMLSTSGMINNELNPESGWSKEISASLSSKTIESFLKASLFHMNIQNTIITKRIDEDQFEKINGGSSIHQGVEVEWKVLTSSKKFSWTGSYTFNANHFKKFIDNGNDYSENHLPGTPDHRSYNRVDVDLIKKLNFSVEHQWVSGVFLTDDNSVEAEGYQLVHTRLEYKFDLGTKTSLSFNAKIHNLLDTHYSPMFQINALGAGGNAPRYYYPGKPRSFYVGLAFNQSF